MSLICLILLLLEGLQGKVKIPYQLPATHLVFLYMCVQSIITKKYNCVLL